MNKFILFFSSAFGTGYIKYAPGTFGTLAGLLLWKAVMPDNFWCHAFALVMIFLISVVLSSEAEKIYAKKDDQRIVIDEVAGIWFSLAFLPGAFLYLAAAFVLFRFFDVKKPLFISKLQKIKGGLGVTLDDVAAGIIVNLLLQLLNLAVK
ncbi:MAG: phosphatidylglycerophosphatase A [Endomicrobium sp.]|jgi:phosphatidylglycerophosphatase A|nr:phosphatidylglycerophosphatase A [Endomicrobium sp.]